MPAIPPSSASFQRSFLPSASGRASSLLWGHSGLSGLTTSLFLGGLRSGSHGLPANRAWRYVLDMPSRGAGHVSLSFCTFWSHRGPRGSRGVLVMAEPPYQLLASPAPGGRQSPGQPPPPPSPLTLPSDESVPAPLSPPHPPNPRFSSVSSHTSVSVGGGCASSGRPRLALKADCNLNRMPAPPRFLFPCALILKTLGNSLALRPGALSPGELARHAATPR